MKTKHSAIGFLVLASLSCSAYAEILADQFMPNGDLSIAYPQICIRTNRTPNKTDMGPIIKMADEIARKFPENQPEQRAKAVLYQLTTAFGSGKFGHTWINVFHDRNGAVSPSSYSYREDHGYVKNGNMDKSDRKFSLQRCAPLNSPKKQIKILEEVIVPELNMASYFAGQAMGMSKTNPVNGAYTPIHNCAWFSGIVWNVLMQEEHVFAQSFNGAAHADLWGMPFMKAMKFIYEPGMVAEGLKKAGSH
ncbi:hypothetical protein [Chromobacterium sp. LK1]|uniref:hypothetical protein n=1 Tax=Chromobacterium sp. LK1 TaxID=1628193 RepID=UPI00069D3DAD|nr:hypothetical protein [Chromobacterium sp. LK1]